MPTLQHEALVYLFRNRPQFVAELMAQLLGVQLPDSSQAQVVSGEVSQVVAPARSADLVIQFGEAAKRSALIVEVQQQPDNTKPYRWPEYMSRLRSEQGCPVYLLVVAPNEAVASWCRQPIAMGHPDWVLVPLVLSLEQVPAVVDVEQAKRALELAVLSAMAHGWTARGLEVAQAVLKALMQQERIDDERAVFYSDVVLAFANELARKELDKMLEGYQYQSDFAKNYLAQKKKELAESRAEGRVEGEAKGRTEGRTEGRALALLTMLTARGLDMTEARRQRILNCTEVEQLDRWIQRSVHVRTVSELFVA